VNLLCLRLVVLCNWHDLDVMHVVYSSSLLTRIVLLTESNNTPQEYFMLTFYWTSWKNCILFGIITRHNSNDIISIMRHRNSFRLKYWSVTLYSEQKVNKGEKMFKKCNFPKHFLYLLLQNMHAQTIFLWLSKVNKY
jgi:hypothetical protein